MPGMDGFQAVQTIKNNPRTSAIPILMYTSQEGDLYLGQARALGAEGVLPKQIKQSDVTRMLYQLRLVEDRRGEDRITFTPMTASADLLPANESAIVVTPPPSEAPASMPAEGATSAPVADIATLLPQLSLEIRAALDTTLQKEIAALRGYLGTTLSAQAERLQGDLAVLLPAPRTPDLDVPTMMPERRPWGAITGWSLTLVAGVAAAFFYWSWWAQGNEVAVLRSDLSAAQAEVEALRARPEVVSQAALPAAETFVPTDGSTTVDVAAPPAVPEAAPLAAAATPAPVLAASPAATPATEPAPAAPAAAPATQRAQ
jgi:CheY-like chemotaxis protein